MAEPAPPPPDQPHVTNDHAGMLESYFALFWEPELTTIGSGQIVRWFREHGWATRLTSPPRCSRSGVASWLMGPVVADEEVAA